MNCDRHRRRSPSDVIDVASGVTAEPPAYPPSWSSAGGRRGRHRRDTVWRTLPRRARRHPVGVQDWPGRGAIIRSHAAGTGAPLDDGRPRDPSCCGPGPAAGYGRRPDLPRRLLELRPPGPAPGAQRGPSSLRRPGPAAHPRQLLIGEGKLRGPGDPPQGPTRRVLAGTGWSRWSWPRRRAWPRSTGPSRCRRCSRSRCTTP
jgi:hypothetical protein